jgi:hypothetical protein
MNDFMTKFRNWYIRNWLEITWFLMGWLALSCLEAFSKGQWVTALIDAVLIYVNYAMARR